MPASFRGPPIPSRVKGLKVHRNGARCLHAAASAAGTQPISNPALPTQKYSGQAPSSQRHKDPECCPTISTVLHFHCLPASPLRTGTCLLCSAGHNFHVNRAQGPCCHVRAASSSYVPVVHRREGLLRLLVVRVFQAVLFICRSSSAGRKRDISADALAGYSKGIQLDTKQEGPAGLPTDR